jgi:hypothetical protein
MQELYVQGLIQAQPVSAELKERGIKIGAVIHPSGQTDVPGYDTHEKEDQDTCPEKGWNHEKGAFNYVLSQELGTLRRAIRNRSEPFGKGTLAGSASRLIVLAISHSL